MITAINSTKELMQEAHELHDHRFSNAASNSLRAASLLGLSTRFSAMAGRFRSSKVIL